MYNTNDAQVLSHSDYTVGWICAVPVEMAAAKALLDAVHEDLPIPPHDPNSYTLGRVGKRNVVIACLPSGKYGNTSATAVAIQLLNTFPSIQFGLMVGIGGGVPNQNADIRLGDVVVSQPTREHGGVVQYDYGKALSRQFEQTGMLNQPPQILLRALSKLQANHLIEESQIPRFLSEMQAKLGHKASTFAYPKQKDRLYHTDYDHIEQAQTCELCNNTKTVSRYSHGDKGPIIHYGLIASGNSVIKNSHIRDWFSRQLGISCVEMEAAGLMDNFPCLVICDYADSHKNNDWQGYAAAVVAAFAKELLLVVPVISVDSMPNMQDILSNSGRIYEA
jgi:nucleoside phosphorylase